MRLISVFRKTLTEQRRDLLALLLTFAFAPCVVLIYAFFFSNTSTTYSVLVVNQDEGAVLSDGSTLAAGEEMIARIDALAYPDGKPMVEVRRVESQAEAEAMLRDHDGTLFLVVPPDFSRVIAALQAGDRSVTTNVTFGGDLTSAPYAVGAAVALTAGDAYIQEATAQQPLIGYTEVPLGGSAARTEFDYYIPGVMVFAVIMMIFLASMTVAREVEAGTLRRLQITRMTSGQYLGGTSLALVIIGAINVALTFAVALAAGFHSTGPIWVAALIGAITSLSIIGVGMLVACASKTVSQAFIIANFPLALFMFFTGAMFPLPPIRLFEVAGHAVNLFDFLPPTHAVSALNKVLTLGAGLGDVAWELGMLIALSALYFGVGVWLFRRMHLRAA